MSPQAFVRLRQLFGRTGGPAFGVAGHLLNAGTNVVTAYIASLLLRPEDFGRFVLAFAVVTIVLAAGRGLIGSTMMIHLPVLDEVDRRALVRSALGFTLVLGLAATAVLSVVGLGPHVLWWFAPWVTVVLLQDVGRYVFLAAGRTGRALGLDVAWAVVQAVVIGGSFLIGAPVTLGLLASAWGLGALAGLAAFAVLHPSRPALPGRWWRATRDVAGWFVAVAVLGQVEIYLVLLLAGLVLGPTDVGGLRAVQLLAYQPAVVVLGALLTVLQPVAVRARSDPRALRRVWRRLSLLVAPVIGVLALLILVREPVMGVFFPQYVEYAQLVTPTVVQCAFLALSVAALVVLRGMRRGPTVFAHQVLRLVASVAAAYVGAILGGTLGLAWALAAASAGAWLHVAVVTQRAVRREVAGMSDVDGAPVSALTRDGVVP